MTGIGQSDTVAIQWTVNGTSSASPSEWQLFVSKTGINVNGTSTASTLTMPTVNETTVECIATGAVDGVGYYNTTGHTLYIQGSILL